MPRMFSKLARYGRVFPHAFGQAIDADIALLKEAGMVLDGLPLFDKDLLQRIFNDVAQNIRPTVNKIMTAKYAKSGLKVRTGKLLKAVRNCTVSIKARGGRWKMFIYLQPGVTPYLRQKGANGFYRAASSTEYGALHKYHDQPPRQEGGDRKRQRIKENIINTYERDAGKMKYTKKRGFQQVEPKVKEVGRIEKRGNKYHTASGAYVVAPKSFFRLNAAEIGLISEEIAALFVARLDEMFGRAAS